MSGLPDTIEAFSQDYQIRRRATGAMVEGKYTPGSPTMLPVRGSLQPLGGRELLRLPEGERSTERRIFFTTTKLFAGPVPDELLAGDETWEVEGFEDWTAYGGFYRFTLAKVED